MLPDNFDDEMLIARSPSHLELVILEHLDEVLLLHLQPLEGLLLLHDLLGDVVQDLEVRLRDLLLGGGEHVVVEAVFDGRAVAEVAAVDALHGLAEDVGGGVPEDGLALFVVELDELELAVGLEGPVEVPEDAVHLGDDRGVGQTWSGEK